MVRLGMAGLDTDDTINDSSKVTKNRDLRTPNRSGNQASTVAKIIGDNLLNARKAKGYSREQVADFVSVSANAIGGYETGRILPPIDKLFTLAEKLGVSINKLIGNVEENLNPEKKIFEYRLQRATEIAFAADFIALRRDDGSVDLVSLKHIHQETSSVSFTLDESFRLSAPVDFVSLIETTEIFSISSDITFRKAINDILSQRK